MDSQFPNKRFFSTSCLIAGLLFISFPCYAGEVDWDFFGLTYHLHRKGAVQNAPLKLDHAGVKVFNPGLGLGYDFRADRQTSGFSVVMHGGFFENCNNHPFSFAGAGGRYRKYFHKNYYWETNLLGVMTYGNDSDDKRYSFAPIPYANIGIGRDYGKFSVTYYLSYVPRNSGSKITSQTDMIFMSLGVSF